MTDDNTSIAIQLLGREYRVSCAADERDDLMRAANHLNNQMQEVKEAQVVGLERIAVMAALNIAHELMQAKNALHGQQDQQQRLSQLSERMDKEIAAFNDYRNSLL